MTAASDDEGTWAAEKRYFVAAWRDGVADARDEVADAREEVADAREEEADSREAYLDQWERRLQARAAELGVAPDDDIQAAREHDSSRRHEAASGRSTMLAMAFATIAEQLYDADTVEDVLLRIAQAAVTSVDGCCMASVTVADDDGYRTAAATSPVASAVDAAQYETGQGPSIDALTTSVVYAPAFPDERYPALGSRPYDLGVRSAVSYHLSASSPASADPVEGSLTAYGLVDSAFDDAAREIGLVLAAHASIATRAAGGRERLEQAGQELRRALMSRDVIGQAKGILMERLKVTPDDAFDILRRASQRLNLKLRQVAADLTLTGEIYGDKP